MLDKQDCFSQILMNRGLTLLFVIIVIVIIIILLFLLFLRFLLLALLLNSLSFSFLGCLLLLVFLLERFLFSCLVLGEGFTHKGFCLGNTVGHNNVVKDGSTLHLPKFETNIAQRREGDNLVVFVVVGIVDFGMNPFTFVGGIRNLFRFPFALEFGVINPRSFPGTI